VGLSTFGSGDGRALHGSYLDQFYGWRAVAILAEIGRASLVGRNSMLAAVETCFMFTFRAVAEPSKFEFQLLELSGSGTVDRKDGSTRFTDIVLRSRLTLPKGADPERAKRMLEKGKNACLVTASLSVPVRLESEIVVESA
jgi:uncharacterized OsmC-like protein